MGWGDVYYVFLITGCECMGWGDVHYERYDGGRIDFQGICKYTMTASGPDFPHLNCAFKVDVKNEHRGGKTDVSYTREADVWICGQKISLKQNSDMMVSTCTSVSSNK